MRDAIYDHVFENDDHEVGGVLVGRLGAGSLPVVTGSIAALEADGRRASVTFTHDAWSSIHGTLERDFPDQQIVGWYHSHPGFGIFLSTHDRFIHDNFFSDERQIAYVVDPHAGTEGVFRWRDKQLVLLVERPADRPGTEGRSTPLRANAPVRSWRWYSIVGGVLLVLLAGTVVLLTGSSPPRGHAPSKRLTTGPALGSRSSAGGTTGRDGLGAPLGPAGLVPPSAGIPGGQPATPPRTASGGPGAAALPPATPRLSDGAPTSTASTPPARARAGG